MNFRKATTRNWYLLDTTVENIFINEYMAGAPGDYVKVYLLALMYADLSESLDTRAMAKQLILSEKTVLDAWDYWDSIGVVRKIHKDGDSYDIEFVSAKEGLYASSRQQSLSCNAQEDNIKTEAEEALCEEAIRDMFASIERILGRTFKSIEGETINSWLTDYMASPEMIVYAYNYCKHTMKIDSVKYVGKVVKEWSERGLYTTDKIEEYLAENDRRYSMHKRIFKALGFSRNATEKEKEIMNKWFDSYGFTIDKILEACGKTSGITNPNINYVDKILKSRYEDELKEKKIANGEMPLSFATIQKYYEHLREKSKDEAKRRTKEIYERFPRIEKIDEEIRATSMEVTRAMLSGDKQRAGNLREKTESLMAEKAVILTEANFAPDYMEDKYLCPICKDTGLNDTGERCRCFEQRQKEAKEWQNSLKK